MKKRGVIKTTGGFIIHIKYNPLYIKVEGNVIINKTNKKRYVHCEEILNYKKHVFKKRGKEKNEVFVKKNPIGNSLDYNFMFIIMPNKKANIEKTYFIKKYKKEIYSNKVDYKLEMAIEYDPLIKQRKEEILKSLLNEGRNILFIGDNFTYHNLKNSANVIGLSVSDLPILYYVLERERSNIKVDMLIIESLWRGKNNSFNFINKEKKENVIFEIIQYCQRFNIKTVLYNKEDPPHFHHFLNIAKEVDFVFTTDKSSIEKYEEEGIEAKHLPFFIDEKLFNVFGDEEKKEEKVFFAGSYYEKYEERAKFVKNIFHKLYKDFGLEIYDRNYYSLNSIYKFPTEFEYMVKGGGLPIWELVEKTKNFKYTVNLNSVINSDTMIARRVFEQVALGKVVISNYALSLEEENIDGVVFSKKNDYEEICEKIKKIDNEYEDRLKRSMKILRKYSTTKFLSDIYKEIGKESSFYYPYIYAKISNLEEYNKLRNEIPKDIGKFDLLLDIKNELKKSIKENDVFYIDEFYDNKRKIIKIEGNSESLKLTLDLLIISASTKEDDIVIRTKDLELAIYENINHLKEKNKKMKKYTYNF